MAIVRTTARIQLKRETQSTFLTKGKGVRHLIGRWAKFINWTPQIEWEFFQGHFGTIYFCTKVTLKEFSFEL